MGDGSQAYSEMIRSMVQERAGSCPSARICGERYETEGTAGRRIAGGASVEGRSPGEASTTRDWRIFGERAPMTERRRREGES